jgi:hypothetical protein
MGRTIESRAKLTRICSKHRPAKFHGLFDGRSLTACASFIGPGRSYSALKAALEKGGFRRTKAYRLINLGKIEAYQMEGQTMVDADSIDRYH